MRIALITLCAVGALLAMSPAAAQTNVQIYDGSYRARVTSVGALKVDTSGTPSGTGDVNLKQVGGVAFALGQTLMAGSLPVAIASNQSALAITVASLPLPSGAATEATLSTINGKLGTLGQKTSAGSAPVVLASDQSAIPASQSGTWTATVTQPTASSLNAQVQGPGSAGSPSGGVLSVQGVSGGTGVPVTQATASNLNAQVVGPAASGAAVSGNPVLGAGSDGTNARTIKTDSSGNQIAVGASASGSAVTGSPVLIGGSDGTNARTVKTDSSGQQVIVGAGTAGSASGGVVTIQGVASMTPVKVDGSGVTQPVSGTVTATASPGTGGTTASTSAVNCSSAATLLSSNANALGRKVYNRSGNGALYILYGTGTLTGETDASFVVAAGQTWEMPVVNGRPEYTGAVKCLLASGTSVQALEVSP